MKNKFIVLIVLFLIGEKLDAQQIFGKVINEKGEPIEYVNVLLYKAKDSTFVTGSITNKDGDFSFDKERNNTSYIKLFCLGYQNTIYQIKDKASYMLKTSDLKLGEVIVTAHKPIVKVENEKLIFDVPSLIKQRPINNAFEVLGEIPGVEKYNNSVNIIGANSTTIIINGRVSSMSQDQVIEQLKNLPPERIKSLELIYATPPKYGIHGSSINIIVDNTRKEKREQKAEIMFLGEQAHYFSPSTGFNYSSTNKNSILNVSYSFKYDKSHPEENLEAIHSLDQGDKHTVDLFNSTVSTNKVHNVGVSFDYDLKNKDIISISYNAKCTDPNIKRNGTIIYDDKTRIYSSNKTTGPSNLQNVAISYNHKNLELGGDYSYYNDKTNQFLVNSTGLENEDITSNSRQTINRGSFYINNQYVFKNKQKLSYGINGIIGRSRNKQLSLIDKAISNDFLVTQSECSMSGFTGWSQSIGKNATLNANLELEYYDAKAKSNNVEHSLWSSWSIYPTLTLMYRIAPMKVLQLSISSEKKYPTYWQTTPNITYMNAYILLEGNPSVKPSRNYSGRINYILKGKYIFQLFANTSSDYIQQLLYQSNEKLQAIYKIINLDKHDTYGTMAVLPFKISRFLDSQAILSGFQIHDKGYLEDIYFNRKRIYGRVMLTNNIYFNKNRNISLELNGSYATKALQGIYDVKPMYNLFAGLSWSITNDLRLNLTGDDLLNGRKGRTTTHFQNQNYRQVLNNDTRMVTISIKYNIGGYKKKKDTQIDTSRFGI